MGETVSNVRKIITWITGRHMKVSPAESTRNFVPSVVVVHGEVLSCGLVTILTPLVPPSPTALALLSALTDSLR